jgi:hypothetical protein
MWLLLIGRRQETLRLAASGTTLVLEPAAPVFSTAAGNSALIAITKSPQRPVCACSGLPGGDEKNNNEISIRHDWFTWEGTPCLGESCLAGNS